MNGRRQILYLYVIMFMTIASASAQTVVVNALKENIRNAKTPAEKLTAILSLCEENDSFNKDTLYFYALQAKKIAAKQKNIPALHWASYYEASSYYRKNELDSVTSIIQQHLPVLLQKDSTSSISVSFLLLEARCMIRKQEFKEALSNDYRALNIAELKKDTLNQIRAMAAIGLVFVKTGDYTGALNWFGKGIDMGEGNRYRNKTIYLFTNAAVCYNNLSKYDSAEQFVLKAVQYARASENLVDLSNSLGMYAGQLMDSKKYAEAEKPLREALQVSERMGDPNDIISNMGALGIYYYDRNLPEKGIDISLKALDMINKYQLNGKLPFIYDVLAKNYEAAGKFKQQGEILKKLVDIQDSTYEKNSADAISELKIKFEVQKKENTIIRQQLDLVKKDYLIYASVVVFIIAICIAYFVFSSYKKRQKLRTAMAIATAEESERKRIAANLHDNLGAYAASIASNVNRLSFFAQDSNAALVLKEVSNNSNAIVADLSDTIWALKKESLALTAVSDRLKIFIQRVQPGYPSISFNIDEDIVKDHLLSPSQGFHLFQTLQEAINNALKHSECKHIHIQVKGLEKEWEISIADDGTGMKDPVNNSGGGNGLFNMRNRAEEGGWKIEWKNNIPSGTKLIIQQSVS